MELIWMSLSFLMVREGANLPTFLVLLGWWAA